MLSGTDRFLDRLIEQHITKGEDRGKPSLKRTRREDVPEAHNARELTRRNTSNKADQMRSKDLLPSIPNWITTMLPGTYNSQKRWMEQQRSKGEDRGKPSLKRTRREDVPEAHKAREHTWSNISNSAERTKTKGEDRGKPSLTRPIREDVPWAHSTVRTSEVGEKITNVQKGRRSFEHKSRNTEPEVETLKGDEDGKAREKWKLKIRAQEGELERLRTILKEDPRNTVVWTTLQCKQKKLDEDKLGETSSTPASSDDENELKCEALETEYGKLRERGKSLTETKENEETTPAVPRLKGGSPKKRKLEEYNKGDTGHSN